MKSKIITVPNALTGARLVCGLMLALLAYAGGNPSTAFVLFTFGAITDWLDGKIARHWPSQQSMIGERMDPPADKLLVFGYMIYLFLLWPRPQWIEYICFVTIFTREIIMLILRNRGGANLFPVSEWGKRKTFFQMLALFLYGAASVIPSQGVWPAIGYRISTAALAMLIIATGLTLYSLYQHTRLASPATTPS